MSKDDLMLRSIMLHPAVDSGYRRIAFNMSSAEETVTKGELMRLVLNFGNELLHQEMRGEDYFSLDVFKEKLDGLLGQE